MAKPRKVVWFVPGETPAPPLMKVVKTLPASKPVPRVPVRNTVVTWNLVEGDCRSILDALPANFVDAVVTDPPYDLLTRDGKGGFMGKAWDATGVAFSADTWRKVSRVLKPGGHVLAFGAPRTYHRMVCAMEDAGLEIRDSIHWIFGSGFPKSMNIGKAIDAAGILPVEQRIAFAKELRARREQAGITRKEFANWFPQYTEITKNWERTDDGFRIPSEADYNILVQRFGMSEKWRDALRAEDLRKRIENDTANRQGDGTVLGLAHSGARYEATTEVAKAWEGWGTCLKPGHEPIVLARKPTIGSVIENVQTYGTGGLNIDGCRVSVQASEAARWPANVVFDEEAARDLDKQNTGASRFFYVAKASPAEREGNHHPTVKPVALMSHLVRLVTPPGGLVLDPFAGSGTTGVAARREGLHFIGCEKEPEYAKIAKARLSAG